MVIRRYWKIFKKCGISIVFYDKILRIFKNSKGGQNSIVINFKQRYEMLEAKLCQMSVKTKALCVHQGLSEAISNYYRSNNYAQKNGPI